MLEIKQLQDLCLLKNINIAVAESCTGGNISSIISSITDSSKYFKGGIVAYQNKIKIEILGVPQELIAKNTEVSAEVAETMAYNLLSYFDVNFSIATSGYAGPGGGTITNPVGTVFIAIANQSSVVVKRFMFAGSRQRITNQATKEAILLLLSEIKKYK